MAGARAWILNLLDAERSRWMLWLPVALGLGIAIYFELPSEPALWLGPALAATALVLVFFAPAGSLARAVAIGLVAAAVGFGLIAWRTASVAAPTLSQPMLNINLDTGPRACGSCSRPHASNQVSSRKCWFESDRGHHRHNASGPVFHFRSWPSTSLIGAAE